MASEVKVTILLRPDFSVSGSFKSTVSTSSMVRSLRESLTDSEAKIRYDSLMAHPGRLKLTAVTKKNGNIMYMDESFPISMKHTISASTGLKNVVLTEVTVKYLVPVEFYNRGVGVGTTSGKKLLKSEPYDPQYEFDAWVRNMVGQQMMAVTENDVPVTAAIFDDILLQDSGPDTLTFYQAPFVANYSDVAVPVVFNAVVAEQLTTTPVIEAITTTPINFVKSGGEILNKFLRHGSSPLAHSIADLKSELLTNRELGSSFDSGVKLLVQKLAQINRVYAARNAHNKTAHRLVIHEVVSSACDVLGTEWLAEEAIFTHTKRGKLGYGPLDVFFPIAKSLIRESLDEEIVDLIVPTDEEGKGPTIAELEALEAAEAAGDVIPNRKRPAVGSEDEMEMLEYLRSLEAKVILNDRALAQTVAQMVDLGAHLRAQAAVPDDQLVSVHGILCSAHRWLYFTIIDGGKDTKPALHYRGEVNMRVLRKLQTKAELKKVAAKDRRRPSHCGLDEKEVNEEEVSNVLLALVACMK